MLQGSRAKSALRCLLSLAFVAAGVWMIVGDAGTARYSPEVVRIIGIVTVLAFGFNAGFTFLRALRPARLVLTTEGFFIEGFRPSALVPWNDVEGFDRYRKGLASLAGFRLKAGRRVRDRQMTRATTDYDGLIAVFPKGGADHVVQELSSWRARYAELRV